MVAKITASRKTRKKSGATAQAIAAAAKPEEEEPGAEVVVCLRINGGVRISIDDARDRHDGTHHICVMNCGNQCVNGGRKH